MKEMSDRRVLHGILSDWQSDLYYWDRIMDSILYFRGFKGHSIIYRNIDS